ncbi:MAG TPA: phosphoribosyl-ATP pyrophosphohydrolase [archaeon]|nr:phosphoribosyl-ATP pyrophosphohydrolase [archaeon]
MTEADFRDRVEIHNKLVRDHIPGIIRSKGDVPVIHTANDREFWAKLKDKLKEEVDEFLATEKPEELADIWEVLETIMKHKRIPTKKLATIKTKKFKERGGFEHKVILDEVRKTVKTKRKGKTGF